LSTFNPKEQEDEGRGHFRKTTQFEGFWFDQFDQKQGQGEIKDLSFSGAMLETDQMIAPHTPIILKLKFPDREMDLRLSAQVCWVRPLQDMESKFEIGLRFMYRNDNEKNKVGQMLLE